MEIIVIENLSKRFKSKVLFEHAFLSVSAGQTVGLIGGNGVGKSVLFKLITGLETADEGTIYVKGRRVGEGLDFPENTGLLVNQAGYIGFYSGMKNLELLAEIQGIIDEEKIRSVMVQVGLDPDDTTPVRNYSSGMKQKLGIAQAVMEDQDLILLDEPFNALDFQTNQEIIKILKAIKESGKTLLLTSHQQDYLEVLCDVLYLIDGQAIHPFTQDLKKQYFSLSD